MTKRNDENEARPTSRRGFIKKSASLGALALFPALTSNSTFSEVAESGVSIVDRATTAADPNFVRYRDAMVWQVAKPNRSPDYIMDARSVEDVITAVNYARENDLKIIARSGGHSISGSFLRDNGILLNMGGMQQVSIDPKKKIAAVEPGVLGPVLLYRLQEHGLAFPVARGASVAIGGYVLGGGLGFNPNTWGLAYASIVAAEVVLADGTLVTVSEREHSDIYWAIRGAGPGFFGVITKYYLQAYDTPDTLMTSQYIHPLSAYEKVGEALEELVPTSDHRLELILLLTSNPDREAIAQGGPKQVCIVNVVAYGDEEIDAQTLLASVSKSALGRDTLSKREFQPTSLAQLTGDTSEAFPHGRMATEGVWSDSIAPVIATLRGQMENAVTPITTISIRFVGNKVLYDNAAFSRIGTTNILSVLTWKDEQDDVVVQKWLDDTMSSLQPYSLGYYINNEDIVRFPERNEQSFDATSWKRLRALRKKYDPDRVFHDYFGTA